MKISKKEIKNLSWITLGVILFVVGINMFLAPVNIYTTGLLGLSQEISQILQNSLLKFDTTSIIFWMLNTPIILLGWFRVGKKFTLRTFFAVTLISILSEIIPTDNVLIEDTLLAALTGGLFCGAGLGLTLRYGASTGGTDILAVFISLTKGKGFGPYNILLNISVILLAIYIQHDITVGVLMLICLYTTGVVTDKLHNSHQKFTLFVVTEYPRVVRDIIFEKVVRSCTITDSYGGQSYAKKSMVMVTISKGELYLITNAIKEEEPKAWINIMPVENVVGYFENTFKKML